MQQLWRREQIELESPRRLPEVLDIASDDGFRVTIDSHVQHHVVVRVLRKRVMLDDNQDGFRDRLK